MAKKYKIVRQTISGMDTKWCNPDAGTCIDLEDIEPFLKSQITAKVGATYFDTQAMRFLTFATQDDRDAWVESGDESLVLSSQAVSFASKMQRIVITNLGGGSQMYFTTAASEALLNLSFASQEKEVTATSWTDTVEDYTVSVLVDSGATGSFTKVVSDVAVQSGDNLSVDVLRFLSAGNNRIRIQATGSISGQTATLGLTAVLTSMYISPANFAWYTPFVEGDVYALGGVNIGGALNKTLKIKVTNDTDYERIYQINLGTQVYTTNPYYFRGLEFPSSGTGVYHVDLWLEADNLESEHLEYNIMCVTAAERTTAKLVAISEFADKAVNYADNDLFSYAIYNCGRVTGDPHVTMTVYAGPDRSVVVSETLSDVPTAQPQKYTRAIEVEGSEADMTLGIIMEWGNNISHTYAIDNSATHPAASGAIFSMNPSNRSNAQANRETVINDRDKTEVTATWKSMAWTEGTDGWTADANGRKCLLLPARTKATLDLTPLSSIGTGKTIEFTFMVSAAADYSEPIISVCDDPSSDTFRGIRITPEKILIHSRDLNTDDANQQYRYPEDTLMNVCISIIPNYKVNYGNLAVIYVNGVRKKEIPYAAQDSWLTDGKVILGSETADLTLYGMRVYDRGFGTQDALLNYVASLSGATNKLNAWNKITSDCDDSFAIEFSKVINTANYFVVEMTGGSLPKYGLSKSYKAKCNVEFHWFGHPEWTIRITNVLIEGQGTTSMNYWVWNFRWRLDKDENFVIEVVLTNTEAA